MSNYREFIESKLTCIQESGFESDKSTYNKNLFEWQRDIVHWALRKGKVSFAFAAYSSIFFVSKAEKSIFVFTPVVLISRARQIRLSRCSFFISSSVIC